MVKIHRKKTSDRRRKPKARIGPEPKVVASASIRGGGPASVVIRFRGRSGEVVKIRLPRGDLHDLTPLMKTLANADCACVPLERDRQQILQQQLIAADPTQTIVYSLSTGWFNSRFVLPDTILGQRKSDQPKIAYEAPESASNNEGAECPRYGVIGTLDDWKNQVAKFAARSATMTTAVCLALAAPLLEVCNIEGGGIHLTGESSKGKSSTARVARSVSGPPDLLTWSATINGLEAACCDFNGTLMCIDETGALEGTPDVQAQKVRQAAFKIASGKGKLRLGRQWNTNQKWCIFVLSSGEFSLDAIVAAAGNKRLGGEQVRFPDLPCTAGPHGVFEKLPEGFASSLALVQHLNQACSRYHGTALRAFLGRLICEPDLGESKVRVLMRQFYDYALMGTDGWERRFAEKFALAAAAGLLGVRWNVLPWTEKEVLVAVKRCYLRARNAVPEAAKITKRGVTIFNESLNNSDRVVDLRPLTAIQKQELTHKTGLGFLRYRREHGLHLAIRRQDFQSWFTEPYMAELVFQELDRKGRIKRYGNLLTRQVKLWPGEKQKFRYLVITLPSAAA